MRSFQVNRVYIIAYTRTDWKGNMRLLNLQCRVFPGQVNRVYLKTYTRTDWCQVDTFPLSEQTLVGFAWVGQVSCWSDKELICQWKIFFGTNKVNGTKKKGLNRSKQNEETIGDRKA